MGLQGEICLCYVLAWPGICMPAQRSAQLVVPALTVVPFRHKLPSFNSSSPPPCPLSLQCS
jgi:hypothetical protein